MKHKVTIKQRSTTQNSYGEPLDQWTSYASNVWASVEPLTGKEFFSSQQIQSEVNFKIKLYYDSSYANIKPSMMVEFDSRTFEIVAVMNYKERNKELLLMCKELM